MCHATTIQYVPMPPPPIPEEATVERLEKAERLKMMGKHREALDILEQLLIEDPSNVAALEEVADNELSLEHYARAKKAAQQAIELDAGSYTAHYLLGCLHAQKQQWKQALASLQTANQKRPNDSEILRCLGWALFQNGKRVQGIVTLERALNIDNDNPFILCDLGAAYLQARNVRKAKPLLERALEIDPENPRAQRCAEIVAKISTSTGRESKNTKHSTRQR